MNEAAWDLLCERLKAAKGSPAEQIRTLAAINEFVGSTIGDVLRITADGLEQEDEDDSTNDNDGSTPDHAG